MSEQQVSRPTLSARQLQRKLLEITRPVLLPLWISLAARVIALLATVAQFAVIFAGIAALAPASVPETTEPVALGGFIWGLIAASVLRAAMRYVEQFAGHTVAFKSLALLRGYFFAKLRPQAPAATLGSQSGDLVARATRDIDRIEVFFAHTLVPAAAAVLAPALSLIWLFPRSSAPLLLTVLGALAVLGLAVPRLAVRKSQDYARTARIIRGDLAQHITDTVQGAPTVSNFNFLPRRSAELRNKSATLTNSLRGAGVVIGSRRALNAAGVGAGLLAIILVGSQQLPAGTVELSGVLYAVAVYLGCLPAVLAVEDFAADLAQAWASARRVFDITEADPLVKPGPREQALTGPITINFNNVYFAYPGRDTQVLKALDLEISAGKTTALVGASGAGKSTVGHLIARFWSVQTGQVLFNGVDINEFSAEALAQMVTVVSQRPHLFNDTVAANIAIGNPEASGAQIAAAARAAALEPWLETLPDGINTPVGEAGALVSGGQRQRIAIARALLANTPVVILDEITSGLDRETEQQVLDSLSELVRGRTVIMIAHRLHTVAHADQIVVFDSGRVLQRGTHAELSEVPGGYQSLLARQE